MNSPSLASEAKRSSDTRKGRLDVWETRLRPKGQDAPGNDSSRVWGRCAELVLGLGPPRFCGAVSW